MATMREVATLMDALFPPENVCMDDSIGLMVGSFSAKSDRALVCLDCTSVVADEAKEKNIKIIITHHPLIFRGIDRVTDGTPTGDIVLKAARAGISVFSAHTNMDCSKKGINVYAADLMNLSSPEPLIEINNEAGLGVVGNTDKEYSLFELAKKASDVFGDKYVKPYGRECKIHRAAIVNGSGADIELIDAAIEKGATCLITGEVKHHVAIYAAEKSFCLIEVGHYASEHVYIPKLCELLNAKAEENNYEIQFIEAESESDPAW